MGIKYVNEIPGDMFDKTVPGGEVRRFEYDTRTYDVDADRPMHKGAWVYLPHDYSDSRQYDILYLLHGGGVNEDWWFQMFPDTVVLLDNMIEKKICPPCIVAAPTYYRGDDTDRDAEYITEHFCHELRRDLIPGVESAFSTWAAGDVSEENLVKTRNHRGFAGLSLGSMTTYRAAFYNNFDLFSWYGAFSGCCGPWGNHDREVERIKETLDRWEKDGLKLDYLLCCNGDKDIAYAEHKDIMDRAQKICPQLVCGKTYDFHTVPGGVHDMKAWQLHLYLALQIFFAKRTDQQEPA